MALVAFLRGVNVGGHKTFRPSVVAKALSKYDVVNVGAAGTFVIRRPGARAEFLAVMRKHLPFECAVALCDGRDLLRLEAENPWGAAQPDADVVRFVSVLVKTGTPHAKPPFALPSKDEWLVRIVAADKRFVFGEYRRHMKTIGYLSQMDKEFGATATTRNWNTIGAVLRILKGPGEKVRSRTNR